MGMGKFSYGKAVAGASLICALFFGAALPNASAATTTSSSTCTPTLSVQKTKETSVSLKVTCLALKSKKVSMKIQVENNDDNDSTSTKTATAKLGKTGMVTFNLSGLDAGTSYTFKVKIKDASKSAYSSYSAGVDTTTKGSDYDPKIDSIKSITESSAKLNISCDDLENEAVNVQVAYKKKDSWSVKSFDLTLDDDGEGSIKMESLKSETEYSFKIRIKKSGEDTYSAYSSVKTATTDEE